jgi:Fe-S-cluster-containing dehydrogenase component
MEGRTRYLHCHRPGYLEVCPEDAITKWGDGVVLIDAGVTST